MPVLIVSNIVPLAGRADEVLEILRAAIPPIQRLPGCELYAIHRGRGRSRGQICLLEKWADDEAFDGYGRSVELDELHRDVEPLIESLEDFKVYAPILVGDPAKGAV